MPSLLWSVYHTQVSIQCKIYIAYNTAAAAAAAGVEDAMLAAAAAEPPWGRLHHRGVTWAHAEAFIIIIIIDLLLLLTY